VVGLTVVALVGVSWVALLRTETPKTDEDRKLTAPLGAEDESLPRQRKQPVHTTRRITEFLGVDLSGLYDPKHCNKHVVGNFDHFKFETECCRIKENEAHTVGAIYVTDTRFPDLVGRILRVSAILNNSVFADQAAFEGYMGAFTEKYGPLQPIDDSKQLTNVDQLLFCSGSSCDEGSVVYDPEASHLVLVYPNLRNLLLHEVSFSNTMMFLRMSEAVEASRKKAAAAAVE